ncbi:hypothetical protein V5O48_013216 [Marasmius crinis-equi]|uniref:Uncharacterized protein n=1 Tax=Marasmius crinis-equi TaxID=585013 RepID=A0ABR3F0N1_9AGAR
MTAGGCAVGFGTEIRDRRHSFADFALCPTLAACFFPSLLPLAPARARDRLPQPTASTDRLKFRYAEMAAKGEKERVASDEQRAESEPKVSESKLRRAHRPRPHPQRHRRRNWERTPLLDRAFQLLPARNHSATVRPLAEAIAATADASAPLTGPANPPPLASTRGFGLDSEDARETEEVAVRALELANDAGEWGCMLKVEASRGVEVAAEARWGRYEIKRIDAEMKMRE